MNVKLPLMNLHKVEIFQFDKHILIIYFKICTFSIKSNYTNTIYNSIFKSVKLLI